MVSDSHPQAGLYLGPEDGRADHIGAHDDHKSRAIPMLAGGGDPYDEATTHPRHPLQLPAHPHGHAHAHVVPFAPVYVRVILCDMYARAT